MFGTVVGGEVEVALGVESGACEDAGAFAVVVEIGDGDREVRLSRQDREDADELARIRVRQGAQKHAVDKAENCGVCANAKRQRENSDDREA